MVGSFCLVRTTYIETSNFRWGLYLSLNFWRDFFSLLIHKSYFIPYVVNYEVGITLMSSDCMYYYFWDTLFSVHYVVRTQKKSKCQRHKKVKLPSNPGITHSKSKKETLATTVVACVCRDFEILQEYCFAASPQKSKSCRP